MRIDLTFLAPLLNLILSICTAAQSPSSDQDKVKAFLDQVNRPVVYSITAMDQARVKRDIVYKKDASADFLRMDLYLPPDTKDLLPVVILIHGGVYSDVPLKPKDWDFTSLGEG
jgi:acetyl esterase/lipase